MLLNIVTDTLLSRISIC